MQNILHLLKGIRSIGPANTLRALIYPWQRDQWEKRDVHLAPSTAEEFIPPGRMSENAGILSGALFDFEHARLEVVFLSPDVLRISWTPGNPPVPYAIADTAWDAIEIKVNEEGNDWRLDSADLQVNITEFGGLSIHDDRGVVLREDLPPLRSGDAWKLHTQNPANSAFYGLGERAARLNLNGGSYRLWNKDPGGSYGLGSDPLNLTIPVFHHLHEFGSYMLFLENSYDGHIAFHDPVETYFTSGMLRYYFFLGPPERAMHHYAKLTGRPPLPPLWSLGFHQSRWGYQNEGDIREVSNGYRVHDLPLSVIHLDIDYMDGYRVFTIDKKRFPDLGDLALDLERENTKLVAILDPGVKIDRNYEVFKDGLERDVFCKLPQEQLARSLVWPGWVYFPDFTNPKARTWWGEKYRVLLNQHIAGFWHDMNEPSAFAAWGEPTLPGNARHYLEGQGGDHRQAHNLYGLLMNRAGFEALREYAPNRRPFILSRSGWAGMQRYAWNWTGDIETSWEMLRTSIASMLGIGLSGVPYTGSDIGGFSGAPDDELFLRWFQMAAFTPFFRIHSALMTPRREPWEFEDATLDGIRSILNLRYALLPYIYTLAREASQSGFPLMRPMFWIDPTDSSLWDIDDQFLLGDSVLVAPIVETGATSRKVHLPEGNWFDFRDDQRHEGNQTISTEAALQSIPLFIRGGAVLPMKMEGLLELHIYLLHDGIRISQLYSDEGDGYEGSRMDRFRLEAHGERVSLTWENEGEYAFPYPEIKIIPHGFELIKPIIDGETIVCDPEFLVTGMFRNVEFQVKSPP